MFLSKAAYIFFFFEKADLEKMGGGLNGLA